LGVERLPEDTSAIGPGASWSNRDVVDWPLTMPAGNNAKTKAGANAAVGANAGEIHFIFVYLVLFKP
jgi:hypothetical protein